MSHTVLISDVEFDAFMAEIHKLKPKKRRHFKSFLTDKWGQRTRVVFRNGCLHNYSLHTHTFVPIVRQSDTVDADSLAGTAWGAQILGGAPIKKVVSAAIDRHHTGNHADTIRNQVRVPCPSSN